MLNKLTERGGHGYGYYSYGYYYGGSSDSSNGHRKRRFPWSRKSKETEAAKSYA